MSFSFSRFIALIKRDFILRKKTIFLLIAALFIIGIFVMFLVADEIQNGVLPDDAGEIVFVVMLLLCGMVFTAGIFSEFNKAETRIEYLSLPASTFEKWLSKWMYSLPLYIMLTCILFSIVYIVFGPIVISILWSDLNSNYHEEIKFLDFSQLRFEYFRFDILIYFILHSFIFLAAVIFNKYTLPKALLSYGLIILIGVFVMAVFYRLINFEHFTGLFKEVKPMVYEATIKESSVKFFEKIPYIFACIGVPFIWLISYFKLKEKQI